MKIHVVTEGKLEVPVAKRLIAFCGHSRGTIYPVRGYGNIGKAAGTYACLADDETAVLVLTDFMDSKSPCPVVAKKNYLGKRAASVHQNFLLRFAVNELESWLLADHDNFARLLGVRADKIASQPDMLPDPIGAPFSAKGHQGGSDFRNRQARQALPAQNGKIYQ